MTSPQSEAPVQRLGFTGSRVGMKEAQEKAFWAALKDFAEAGFAEFHHGDCLGADHRAHSAAMALDLWTVGHIPTNESKRAHCCFDEQRKPKHYIARNHAIVDETDHLLAAPGMQAEEQRSGTWATIRHARRTGKPITIIWPDGNVKREEVRA